MNQRNAGICALSRFTSVCVAVALATLLPSNARGTVFFDDFNRPNGSVGNGWVEVPGSTGLVLTLEAGEVSQHGIAGSEGGGMYRPIPFAGTVRTEAEVAPVIINGSGYLEHTFGLNYDPGAGSSYRVVFQDNTVRVDDVFTTVGGPIPTNWIIGSTGWFHVDFVVRPDGSIDGTTFNGVDSAPFSFGPRVILATGNQYFYNSGGGSSVNDAPRSRLDDLRVTFVPEPSTLAVVFIGGMCFFKLRPRKS
jgi:hypothetical protein